MMARKKRHWFWNLLLLVSLVVCLLAFAAHYRNWTRLEPNRMQLLSGLYYVEMSYAELDELEWSKRLPQMEREHGFSAGVREKGIFKDSLDPQRRVYVFVDDLSQAKIRVRFRDSLLMYLNFADSAETQSFYTLLEAKRQEFATQSMER